MRRRGLTLTSVCSPACPKSLPGVSAVCYNCISDILFSTLSLQCPLPCDLVGYWKTVLQLFSSLPVLQKPSQLQSV